MIKMIFDFCMGPYVTLIEYGTAQDTKLKKTQNRDL